jgi:SAM-dependent methyltransferase
VTASLSSLVFGPALLRTLGFELSDGNFSAVGGAEIRPSLGVANATRPESKRRRCISRSTRCSDVGDHGTLGWGCNLATNSTSSPGPKEVIRQEWFEAAPLWKKWFDKLAFQSRSASDLVVQGARLSPDLRVLDLASGSGEPALALAKAVGPGGRVVATDLVPEMLLTAQENAQARGLANMEFRAADAEQLPFANSSFDRVTCRFGLMFFPDVPKALAEIRRVLRPGGRVACLVWGLAQENPLFSVMLGPFLKHVNVPPPDPNAPHVFRFAEESKLAGVFTSAGFQEVSISKHKVSWPWPGPPEESWQATSELAAPFKKMIAALPPDKSEEVTQEVINGIRRFYDGQQVNFPASLVSATAVV